MIGKTKIRKREKTRIIHLPMVLRAQFGEGKTAPLAMKRRHMVESFLEEKGSATVRAKQRQRAAVMREGKEANGGGKKREQNRKEERVGRWVRRRTERKG